MIKFLLTLFVVVSLQASAQIEMKESVKSVKIGEVRGAGRFIASIEKIPSKEDTVCVLYYKNVRYTTLTDIQDIVFNDTDSTLAELYNVIQSAFTDENKKKKDFKIDFRLGDKDVSITSEKMFGIPYVKFWTENGFFYLTEKQLDKLFGK